MTDVPELLTVLEEVLGCLRQPDTEAGWSGYELDELLSAIERHHGEAASGTPPDARALADLRFLFLPTGPLQETSISSGWGYRFLDLAARFDYAAESP